MKHTGSCHCQAVRFEAEMELGEVMACNCSICGRRGHLLAFTPEANFKLISGESSLTDYQFGKKAIHHLFCKTCGVGCFGKGKGPDGSLMRAINARCLENVDVDSLKVKKFDGKHLI